MAGPAGAPDARAGSVIGRERLPFDAVLADAHEQEHRRLQRYRTRWIVQQLAVLAVAAGVLALTVPALVGEDRLGGIPAVAVFVSGGWLAYVALMAAVSGAAMAMGLAAWRMVGILRTDDLGAYERAHAPWWAERAR